MSDARLRELERAWKASGTTDDELAFLREEVRLGRVERERLKIAAWCDHVPSATVLDDPSARASFAGRSWLRPPDPTRLPLFARWGREALVRGAIAMAREALVKGDALAPVHAGARAVLACAEAWARSPDGDHAAVARERVAAFMREVESGRGPGPMLWVVPTIFAGMCIAQPEYASRCETAAVDALAHATGKKRDASAGLVWEAVAREVVPWALGRRDPLAASS